MAAEIAVLTDKVRVINEPSPYVALYGEGLEHLHNGTIEGIVFGAGRISVSHAGLLVNGLDPREATVAILSSVGCSNEQVGQMLYKSKKTIANQKIEIFESLEAHKLGSGRRINTAGLARYFIDAGVYRVEQPAMPMKVSPAEWPVVDLVSMGYTNEEIGHITGLSHITVKNHLSHVTARQGWSESKIGRTGLALAALLGKQPAYDPYPDETSAAAPNHLPYQVAL